jgi:quercetin 2,3-dioxygenase
MRDRRAVASSPFSRRDALKYLAAAGGAASVACSEQPGPPKPASAKASASPPPASTDDDPTAVEGIVRLDSVPWPTIDPFLFCVHHDDAYPRGNDALGPSASLEGRQLGNDFAGKDGWRMYHGRVVPGFPRHPHRGFETVTVVRRGLLDHSDSMGAAARYGQGDVQWLTAGDGIQHAEMFPLLMRDAENPVELFQIWLNLPARNKHVAPHFSMLWSGSIPVHRVRDKAGALTEVTVTAGEYAGRRAPPPPPSSWARPDTNDVAIWTLRMEPGARFELPAAQPGTNRSLYFYRGAAMMIAGRPIDVGHRIDVRAERSLALENGAEPAEILLLQGRPIGEPVVKHGPFVMNTREEIQNAFADYRRTEFGGWPWSASDPVHGREGERFARHADGRTERPT